MAPGSADFVVVANRLPVDQVIGPGGETGWKRSPGGLVTALEPLLRQQRGAWIGWPGIAQDDTAAVDEPVFLDGIPQYVPYDGYIDFGRFTTFDLAASYKGFKNWEIFGSIVNVFNEKAPFAPAAAYGLVNFNYNYAFSGATGTQFNAGVRYTIRFQ